MKKRKTTYISKVISAFNRDVDIKFNNTGLIFHPYKFNECYIHKIKNYFFDYKILFKVTQPNYLYVLDIYNSSKDTEDYQTSLKKLIFTILQIKEEEKFLGLFLKAEIHHTFGVTFGINVRDFFIQNGFRAIKNRNDSWLEYEGTKI